MLQHGDTGQGIDGALSARCEKKVPEYQSQNAAALVFGDLLLAGWAALRPTASML